jgi:phosphatidylserine decarboxylase
MTPLSVHFNRAPVAGTVTRIVARSARGENRSMSRMLMRWLWRMEPYDRGCRHVVDNARNTIVIDGAVRAVVVQIADRYVNTVDCFVAEGQQVDGGDKIGMIRMGSQCDLLVAAGEHDLTVTCTTGDRVRAGETVLATWQ